MVGGCSQPLSENNTMKKGSEKKKRSEGRDGKMDGEADTQIKGALFSFCSPTKQSGGKRWVTQT